MGSCALKPTKNSITPTMNTPAERANAKIRTENRGERVNLDQVVFAKAQLLHEQDRNEQKRRRHEGLLEKIR